MGQRQGLISGTGGGAAGRQSLRLPAEANEEGACSQPSGADRTIVSSSGVCRARHSLSHHLAYCRIAGGFAVGDLLKGNFDLSPAQNLLAGAVGGAIGSQILQLLIPALRSFNILPILGLGARSCRQWGCFDGRGGRFHTPGVSAHSVVARPRNRRKRRPVGVAP